MKTQNDVMPIQPTALQPPETCKISVIFTAHAAPFGLVGPDDDSCMAPFVSTEDFVDDVDIDVIV